MPRPSPSHALLQDSLSARRSIASSVPVVRSSWVRSAEPHQRDLHGELHVRKRSVPKLEVELRRLGRLHALALDALAHLANLASAVERDPIGRIREVGRDQHETTTELFVARRRIASAATPGTPTVSRVRLPVLQIRRERPSERAVAAFGPKVRIGVPARVAHPAA